MSTVRDVWRWLRPDAARDSSGYLLLRLALPFAGTGMVASKIWDGSASLMGDMAVAAVAWAAMAWTRRRPPASRCITCAGPISERDPGTWWGINARVDETSRTVITFRWLRHRNCPPPASPDVEARMKEAAALAYPTPN